MKRQEKLTAHCNWCKNDTYHTEKAGYDEIQSFEYWDEEEQRYISSENGELTYQIIECNGCGSVSYRQEYVPWLSEFHKFAPDLAPKRKTTYFPIRSWDKLFEMQVTNLPSSMRRAYQEVLAAYNSDLHLLCAAGLRSIVEGLCTQFKIAEKDLSGKPIALGTRIRELATKRFISANLADALRTHKELGNDAVHNLVVPSKEELKLAIGLIETAFENLFNVSKQHEELGGRMTSRILP